MSRRCAGFRQRLLSGAPLIGTFVKTPSPIICEVLSDTPLDALCLDAEHAPFDRLALDGCLAMTRLADMPSLVRVPGAGNEHLLNALDCGATGVLVPHVTSAAQAAEIVRHCHYGRGGRGYAGSSRAAAYGSRSMADQLAISAEQTTVVLQIEDVEALDAIEEIAAVPGVDCLFIGRIDLTVALGAASPDEPDVVAAVKTICAAATRANRRVGMFVTNPVEAKQWRDRGASLFLLSSDQTFLRQGAASLAGVLAE